MEKERNTGTYSSIPWEYESGLKEDSCNRARKSTTINADCDFNGDDDEVSATLSDTPVKKRLQQLSKLKKELYRAYFHNLAGFELVFGLVILTEKVVAMNLLLQLLLNNQIIEY